MGHKAKPYRVKDADTWLSVEQAAGMLNMRCKSLYAILERISGVSKANAQADCGEPALGEGSFERPAGIRSFG